MSRPVINLHLLGRWGNQCFCYAFAAAYAERHGCELRTDPWVGHRIFEIDHNPIREDLPRRSDHTLIDGEVNVSLRGYFQNARSAIYNQEQVRRFFRFRPHVESLLAELIPPQDAIIAHLRRGDYVGQNSPYPLVSRSSYFRACEDHGLPIHKAEWISEEEPWVHPDFQGELAFVPDFFRLAKAHTILRANSSFSFWAAAIAEANQKARVFSPVIDGLIGGEEHDCRFVQGNNARIADFDFVDPIKISA